MVGLFNDLKNLATNKYGIVGNTVTKGSLISFEYPKSFSTIPNIIHDPRPMLIVTDVWEPNYIRGLNLHYLTFPYIKKILETWGGNQGFSYYNIKADQYVALSFRMYSLKGVIRPKRLDVEWLQTVLKSVRTFDVGEIEKIKSTIEQQIKARLQVKAKELTSYERKIKENIIINNKRSNTGVNVFQNILNKGNQTGNIVPETQEFNQNMNTATGDVKTYPPENI